MGKNLNFLVTVIFTITSIVGFVYLSYILFVQIPAGNFLSSHDYAFMYGFVVCGAFIVIGSWSILNQIKLRKF